MDADCSDTVAIYVKQVVAGGQVVKFRFVVVVGILTNDFTEDPSSRRATFQATVATLPLCFIGARYIKEPAKTKRCETTEIVRIVRRAQRTLWGHDGHVSGDDFACGDQLKVLLSAGDDRQC